MEKSKLKNLRVKYFIIVVILSVIAGVVYNYLVTQKEKEYLKKATHTYTQAYNVVYNQYKEMSNLVFSGLIHLTDAKKVFQQLDTLTDKEKSLLRNDFYKKTLPRYETLKSKHIKSINYILADNTMFLKMNNPKLYGQKITQRRHSVHHMHKYQKAFDTYEMGKHGEGFKFFYPIINNETYLGLIEITYGAEAITSVIMEQYNVLCNFHIHEKNFNKKLLIKKPNLYKQSIHKGFILDIKTVKELEKVTKAKMKKTLPSKKTRRNVYTAMQKEVPHSLYDETYSQVFTILPIFHKLTKDKDAVFVIRSNNEQVYLIHKFYYFGLFLIILIISLIVFSIYQNHMKMIKEKEKLENEKHLKEEVLQSKDELKAIFDNAQVGLMYISGERILLKGNQVLADIFGYENPDEMAGISMRKLHLSEKSFVDYGKQIFDSLKMGVRKNIEYQLKRKDGTPIWCELSGKTIDNKIPADMSKGVLWVISDISLKKQYQAEIERQKEEFETIFNYAHDGIAIVDLNRNFLNFNQAFMNLTGFTKEELRNENCSNLTSSDDRVKNDQAIERAIETGETVVIEKECILQNGAKRVSVVMSATLLPDKQRVLLLLHDTTMLKTMQEQSKMASMGEMIGNIAHQWRQPLSVISTGATGILMLNQADSLSSEELEKTCNMINDNAQYLSKTIDDFRDFIKGDRKYVSFDLKNHIESFLNLVKPSIKRYHLNLVLNLEENIILDGYPNELTQCFMNIFNNAKDVLGDSENEEKYIFIDTYLQDSSVIIRCKDNGGGIPHEIISKVFDPYFTTKHSSQGTGLGLHMTYKLVTEGMNGTIIVHNLNYEYNNKIYEGAEFIITLPLK